MSLLRADKISNRFNNTGPIIVGPSTVSGNFTVTGILTALGIGVTNSINVGQAITTKYLTSTNGTSLFNSSLTGVTTVGIVTGATYYGNGVHLSGVVTSVYPGPGIQISPTSGQGRVRISATGVAVAGYSTNAGLSTDVKGGVAGAVLWQVGPNDTGFTAAGTAGEILQSTGTGAPIWTNVSAINVAYADSTGISTNLKGGSSGRIPYQTGIDATGFLPIGSTGKILLGQGTLAPTWIDPKASLDVKYSNLSGIATNVIGGVSSVTSLNVTGITTLGGGNVTVENDLNVSGITTSGNLIVTGVGTIGEFYVGVGVAATVGVTTILDEDTMSSDRADALATQQSIKAYVDAQVTAQDLDFNADVGSGAIDLDSEEFTIAGTTNEIYTIGLGNTVTVGLDTNVTIPQDFTVTRNTTLSGLTTITGSLGVTGVTTTQSLQVIGVSSVGTAITMYPSTGIVSATAFYGDGSNITGISSTPIVTNILYVTTDGDDINNDGKTIESSKRTVGAALTLATTSTVIKISAGNYSENNPLVMPEQVSIQGDSLREVSLTPQNINEDFIYVSNGDYIDNVSFTGILNNDKAVIAFNPNKPSYINQGPYIRNCTNFITNSIGMKIDGNHAIGDTKSMSVDSYTQYNQGGIGVSISNEGYAQLVSIFTICTDQSIICLNGGACDLTNSNSSFGRLGLVADGVGPQNFIGTVTTAANVDSSTFTLDIGADTLTITDAVYDNISGLVTVTTNTNHGFNVGMSVTMKDLTFTCDSLLPVTSYGISTANYDNISGIMTVQTSTDNNFYVGASVTFSQLVFSCDSGGGPSTAFFPPAPGDGNGPSNHVFDVISVGTSTEFTVQVGPSTIVHNYVDGGNVSISTFAKFPSGAYGYIFTVDQVGAANSFSAYVGVSTLSHTYVSGGEVETFVSRPYDGQVVYFDELYQTISGVAITEGGSGYGNSPPTVTFSAPSEPWGIRATGVANLTNGSVTGVDMISNGRGYTSSPTVTFSAPPSGTTALGTATTLPTYYVVSSATPIVNGITTVTFTENVPYAVGVGTSVPFFKQSRVLASSHAFEYIGSGNTISRALPQRGGVGIQANEIVNRNGGLVVYTSTDQAGNFRIGDGVVINQLDGSISGDAYSRSLFANITPYILALGGGD